MTANEIEVYYRYSELDKQHIYSVVCKHSEISYLNYWIYWLWYRMGERIKQKRDFRIIPFNCSYDESEKLIKSYKSVNRGVDRVVPAIQKHFKKITKHKK